MRPKNLGGFKRIKQYVDHKMELLGRSDKSMSALYGLMFSERENVLFEETDGFRIRKTTYGEAQEEVEARAPRLRRMIKAPDGSKVGLYMENSPQWIIAFWAILRAGYCPLLLNTRFSDAATEDVLARYGAAAVVTDGKAFSVPSVRYADLTGEGEPYDGFGEEMYVLSSGTSSVKLCVYSGKELAEMIGNSRYVLTRNKRIKQHYRGELKLLAFLPFYHIFGFVAVYLWFGFFSRTFVKLNDLAPQTILNTIRLHRVTHIFAVPLFWNTVYRRALAAIAERGEATQKRFEKGLRLSALLGNTRLGMKITARLFREVRQNLFGESIRFMITGGSCISADVMKFFNGVGYPLVNGYGMSETGITSVELSGRRKQIVRGSVGAPLPTVRYRIGEGGRLFVAGTTLARSVWENGVRVNLKDGMYETADLAAVKRGKYYLLGRADDLIVSVTGENLNPVAVEEELAPAAARGSCLVPRDQALPVFLVSVERSLPDRAVAELVGEVKERMKRSGLAPQIGGVCVVTDPLIGRDEFKLNRKRIARDYADGAFTIWKEGAKDPSDDGELTRRIKAYFAVALGKNADEIGTDTDFFLDEGGASLEYFALVTKLQEDFSVPFSTDTGRGPTTVRTVVDYLKERL